MTILQWSLWLQVVGIEGVVGNLRCTTLAYGLPSMWLESFSSFTAKLKKKVRFDSLPNILDGHLLSGSRESNAQPLIVGVFSSLSLS
jgi:hypothetical protein